MPRLTTIEKIERYRNDITKMLICQCDLIPRRRRFDMHGKIKPRKLKLSEFAILVEPAGPRLYRFGGFSDSEDEC
jgi:hypothetical protein